MEQEHDSEAEMEADPVYDIPGEGEEVYGALLEKETDFKVGPCLAVDSSHKLIEI